MHPASTYGTHTLLFFLDSKQATEESSEGNNLLVVTYEFAGCPTHYKPIPDFAITNIVLNPTDPDPGQSFTAKVYVVNSGHATGNAGRLSVWVSKSEAATNSDGADFTSVALGAWTNGEAWMFKITGLTAPAITEGRVHHFRAFIDSTNATAESSEGNNQKTVTYFFEPQPGDKADLSIIDLSVSPSPLTPNCAFTATVTVVNSGPVASPACRLAVWADHGATATDETGATIAAIGALAPDVVTDVVVTGLTTPSAASGWTHKVRAFVDSGKIIEEQSEGNNQLTLTYEYPH